MDIDLTTSARGTASPATPHSGQLIAFMACKGGAGASFLATSLAHLLATEFDKPCALIDLDVRYGDASFYLGQTAQPNTIADLITPAHRLDPLLLASCMYTVAPGLQMLSAPPDMAASKPLQPEHTQHILTLACSAHPLVLVDLPRSLEPHGLAALAMADVVYLVMDNTMAALRDAQRCLQYLQTCGTDTRKVRLLINKHTHESTLPSPTVHSALGIPVRHRIPLHNEAVQESINLGQALAQVHPHSPVAEALRQLAADLLQMPAPQSSSWLSRWLGRSAAHRPTSPDTARSLP